jgi:hypothetical protein
VIYPPGTVQARPGLSEAGATLKRAMSYAQGRGPFIRPLFRRSSEAIQRCERGPKHVKDYFLEGERGSGIVYDEEPRNQVDGPMFVIEQKDKDNVAFLCVDYSRNGKVERVPVGTCFFVTIWNHSHSVGHGYLVTAKHVWESLKSYRNAYARFNKIVVPPGDSGVVYRPLKGTWYFHPNPAVDLAVLPWGEPEGNNYTCFSPNLDELILKPGSGVIWPQPEGGVLYYVGLLTMHYGTERNFPVIRTGSLALITEELIEGPYGRSNYHLIDLQAYPGHSGGPVWMFNRARSYLLGILVAGQETKQEILQKKTPSGTETIAYYSLGITLVTPTAKLVELLDCDALKRIRNDSEAKPKKKPVPLSVSKAKGSK